MRDTSDGENVVRATYQVTLRAQREFRNWLERLIETNGFVPLEERNKWFDLAADALLGQGMEIPSGVSSIDLEALDGGNLARVGNIEDLLRFLPYVQNEPKGKPMSYFWQMALAGSRRVFPMAQNKAMSISAERMGRGKRRQTEGEMVKF